MSEREATDRLLRARHHLLDWADGRVMLSDEEIVEASRELARAEAALPPRYQRDSRRSALEWIVGELDVLVEGHVDYDGSVIIPPPVFPAAVRDNLVSARRLIREAVAALRARA